MLERLVDLRLVERVVPVTERAARTRRRTYRIADNFLAFWLGLLDPHRSAISRGLGKQILPVLLRQLDDHMGERWESAFRQHLLRLAAAGERASGPALQAELQRKAAALPKLSAGRIYAVCAREEVTDAGKVLAITAEDIFG